MSFIESHGKSTGAHCTAALDRNRPHLSPLGPQGVLCLAVSAVHLSDGWLRNRQGLIPDGGIGTMGVIGHINTRHRHVDGCWPFDEAAAVQH